MKNSKKYACLYCGTRTYNRYFCSDKCKTAYYKAQEASKYLQSELERRDPNKKSIAQWQKEADLCGLSYGYYRAQVERFGKTFENLVRY